MPATAWIAVDFAENSWNNNVKRSVSTPERIDRCPGRLLLPRFWQTLRSIMRTLSIVIFRTVEILIALTLAISLFCSAYASFLLFDQHDRTNQIATAFFAVYAASFFLVGCLSLILYIAFCIVMQKTISRILLGIFLPIGIFVPLWLFFFCYGV